MIDISKLGNKVEDGGMSAEGRLTHEEFNLLVSAVEENQKENVASVKAISLNGGTAVYPDKNGVAKVYLSEGGTTYSARLYTTRKGNDLVAISRDYSLGINYQSIAKTESGLENAYIAGTLTIQRSSDGQQTWQTVDTVSLNPKEINDEPTDFSELNLGQYFVNGQQTFRLRASYDVVDDEGNITQKGVQSTIDQFSVTYTQLKVEYADDLTQPWSVDGNTLNFVFKLQGEVERNLHVKVTGEKGYREWIYTVGKNEATTTNVNYSKPQLVNNDTEGLLTHGIKTIEAWLTCSDGVSADALSSEHITAQRMVVVDESDVEPKLLIQNLKTDIQNYVGTELCQYILYSPNGKSKVVKFRIANYENAEDYFVYSSEVQANKLMSLPATIEIENANDDTLYAYLNIEDDKGNMLAKRTTIKVDNKNKFTPTLGADLLINPKTRNNSEVNPYSIINAMNEKEIEAEFVGFGAQSDLWVTSEVDNQRVLRVLAGQKLTIGYDWLKDFDKNSAHNVTFEFDYRVTNVTDEQLPIITASESYGENGFIGFQLKPLELIAYSKSKQSYQEQNLALAENERIHISVNIVSATKPKPDTTPISLCRIFVNGIINREFVFNKEQNDWHDNGSKIIIGQDHADIDIYSIRCYQKELTSQQVKANYESTFSTAEEKVTYRDENDLLSPSTGLIDVNRCRTHGKNVIIWHGVVPDHGSVGSSAQLGWWEISQYDDNGNFLPQYSGTICKETKSLAAEPQGSTAKTYYEYNVQTKLKSVSALIAVDPQKMSEDIKVAETTAEGKVKLYGCGLGKDDWATSESIRKGGAQEYAVENGKYMVPDGWVDGNGIYRGKCFVLSETSNYSIKLVGKINYASAMQSHLMGANNAYNDLHTKVVGATGLQTLNPKNRICKEEAPFLFFSQGEGEDTAVYRGPMTFGAGKMDDASMGFDKKETPKFLMIEGSDNNGVLTDFRCPWESKYITYDTETKNGKTEVVGYKYNGTVMVDLDKYKDTKKNINGVDSECPTEEGEANIKAFFNFIYKHNPRIKVYIGDWNAFFNSDSAKDTTYQWWCTSGEEAMKLKRYDQVTSAWVDAGWDEETEQNTIVHLDEVYASAFTEHQGDWQGINTAIIKAIAKHAKENIGKIIHPESLKFHYCYINQYEAGTDNNSKNTYFFYVPDVKGGYIWVLYQDDMDTIKATDNSGFQNKPYYIDRQHPASDLNPDTPLYQGMANVLFDLCEVMYEESGELREMYKKIFNAMIELAPKENKSLMGFQEKYFFSIQKWIPAVAYNEAARIRYEYPTSIGFISDRNVNPITQSCGDQLLAEREFMKKRIILFASYAGWGDFYHDGGGSTGVSGANQVLAIQGEQGSAEHSVKFVGLVPHQYMYIGGRVGQNSYYLGTRCKPNEKYGFDLTGTNLVMGDTASALFGANFFRSFGNLGDMYTNSTSTFTITAKRLTDVTISPSGENNFKSPALVLNAPFLEHININGCSNLGGQLDLRNMARLESLDARGCKGITDIQFPESVRLTEVHVNEGLKNLRLVAQPNLKVLDFEGYKKLENIEIRNLSSFDSKKFTVELYNAKTESEDATAVKTLRYDNISWTDVSINLLRWLISVENAELKGRIEMLPSDRDGDRTVSLADKVKLVQKYGNIDKESNDLYIKYDLLKVVSMSIRGLDYIREVGKYDGKENDIPYELKMIPATANNIAIGDDGHLKLKWQIEDAASEYAKIINTETGAIDVFKMSDPALKLSFAVSVEAETIDGTTVTTVTDESGRSKYRIGFYNRVPQVGDFAYGDGTFSDAYNNEKDNVGLVVMKLPKNDESGKLTGYDVIVVQNEQYITLAGANSSLVNMPWGIRQENAGTNGYTNDELAEMNRTLGVDDVRSTGTTWKSNNNRGGNVTGTNTNYLDSTTEDGFKDFSKDGYNDCIWMDWRSKENTDKLIARANQLLLECGGINLPESAEDLITLRAVSNKRMQLAFPAAYAARLYEPVHSLPLHDAYKKGAWDLPAIGVLMRIIWYSRMGQDASKANESAATIAQTPIFANASKRAGMTVVSEKTNSTYWSSTEGSLDNAWGVAGYNGYVNNLNRNYEYHSLAVAVFDFVL